MKVSLFAKLTLQVAALTMVSFAGISGARAEEPALSEPAQIYMQFHDLLPEAKTLDGLSKYFSKTRWAQMSKDEQTMPRPQFDLMFALFKKLSPAKVSLVSQSLVGDVCILTLKSSDVDGTAAAAAKAAGETVTSSGTGTVTMRKEDGNWKIEMEEWQCSEVIGDKALTSSSLDAAAVAK